MAANINVDVSKVDKKLGEYLKAGLKARLKAHIDIANEILRLSSFEVPHDLGLLQSSGGYDDDNPEDVLVGYNKTYAARLHENPQFHFQKGRKGKYLEDPIKKNIKVFLRYFGDSLKSNIDFK